MLVACHAGASAHTCRPWPQRCWHSHCSPPPSLMLTAFLVPCSVRGIRLRQTPRCRLLVPTRLSEGGDADDEPSTDGCTKPARALLPAARSLRWVAFHPPVATLHDGLSTLHGTAPSLTVRHAAVMQRIARCCIGGGPDRELFAAHAAGRRRRRQGSCGAAHVQRRRDAGARGAAVRGRQLLGRDRRGGLVRGTGGQETHGAGGACQIRNAMVEYVLVLSLCSPSRACSWRSH